MESLDQLIFFKAMLLIVATASAESHFGWHRSVEPDAAERGGERSGRDGSSSHPLHASPRYPPRQCSATRAGAQASIRCGALHSKNRWPYFPFLQRQRCMWRK
jgi:hypothetical protein